MEDLSLIRNFCIIAHIDHGKSTLADRILELTQTVEQRNMRAQLLDSMDLEQERGITIKAHPVTMKYTARNGKTYQFNLIDTPGHVDFTYEVSRSMAACEGALLIVDAAQGVQAQTVANTYLAMDHKLEIIPVINKIDLPSADIPGACRQIEEALAIATDHIAKVSGKTGEGVQDLLELVITFIPPPKPKVEKGPLRAIVFDSVYDVYRGVVTYVRIIDGELKMGDMIRFMGTGVETQVKELGVFSPQMVPGKSLCTGQVGYIIGTVKDPKEIRIGDTVTTRQGSATEALPGFKEIHPMVYSGLYPISTDEYEKVRQSLEKLQLNDSAFTFHPESSVALGFGFRCGFLGLLHMEVVQERLRREFDVDIISTHPAVIYRLVMKDGSTIEMDNPVRMPDPILIEHIEEPMIKATIITLSEHIGDIMRIVMDRRGTVEKTESLDGTRVIMTCTMPLNEILIDFHDTLKSVSRGYASMDYEYSGYQPSDIVKMDILLNGETVDAFSCMVHRDKAVTRGRQICAALKDAIPPHMFKIPVQAAIGKNIIAREDIRPFRKDVTAKLYGGDVTRKQKLLNKQKEGKKRMKQCGSVNVPQEAFVSVLRSTSAE